MALVARFVGSQTRREVSETAPQPVVIAPPTPPPSLAGSSLPDNYWKEEEPKKYSSQNTKTEASSLRSEDKGIWSKRRSIQSEHESSKLNQEDDISAPRLDLIHPVNVTFADAVNYSTNWLYNRSQKYNEKMEAWTAKPAYRMETIMKPYKCRDSNQVTILSFLGQFRERVTLMTYQKV